MRKIITSFILSSFILIILLTQFSCSSKKDDNPLPALVPVVLTSNVVTALSDSTASCGGTITSEGSSPVTMRGVCWSTSANPTISGEHSSDGTGSGVFYSILTGLSPLTTYYLRAYATNAAGTAYGIEETLKTSTSLGRFYAGGIVFQVDETGKGLVCALTDQNDANPNDAVSGCNDLVLNGYDDWYLPSISELDSIYENLAKKGLGNFLQKYYTSSTSGWYEPMPGLGHKTCLFLNMKDGRLDYTSYWWETTSKGSVRAVRKF